MSVRLGVVGLGAIAQKAYLPVLIGLNEVEVAVVASRRAETVERICREYHFQLGVTDLGELSRLDLDAAIVLTPSAAHYAIARELLEAGLDVLIEKPATRSSRETAMLGELAERRGRVLMVAFNRRYAPLYIKARELFANRGIRMCLAEKHRPTAAHPSLWSNYIDDTIHMIDLLRYFGGEGHAVATSSRVRDGKLLDAASVAAFDGGGIGIIATSLEAGAWQERVTLHGDQFTVEVEAFRELRVIGEDSQEIMGRELAGQWVSTLYGRGFVPLLTHFVECVRTRQTPQTSSLEAYRTQVLVEEMVAQNVET